MTNVRPEPASWLHPVIHVVRDRETWKTRCGQLEGPPRMWPAGHGQVPPSQSTMATCMGCRGGS